MLKILNIKFAERHISWGKQDINTNIKEFPANKNHDLDISWLHRKHRKSKENCNVKLFITKSDNYDNSKAVLSIVNGTSFSKKQKKFIKNHVLSIKNSNMKM